MAKRNQYSFSKRQREIRKKKKQEEKRARKLGLPEEGEAPPPEPTYEVLELGPDGVPIAEEE
jgi:hypothetical protein